MIENDTIVDTTITEALSQVYITETKERRRIITS